MTDTRKSGVDSQTGPGPRLLLDVREVRDRMRLRLLASVPAFAGGGWLLWTGDSLLLRILALAGLVFAVIWVKLAQRSVAQLTRWDDHYLDLGALGLTLRTGVHSQTLPWTDITAVEIDEDRLVVQLRLRNAGSMAVEPQYGSLALRELAETIDQARRRAGTNSQPGMRLPQS